MELVWRSRRHDWYATLDGEEVARFGRPPTDQPARVSIRGETWLFTREAGCHSHASMLEPDPLTSRRLSWRTPTREVVTPTGTWTVRFRWLSDALEVHRGQEVVGELRAASWWRKRPLVLRVGDEVPLVEAVWFSWTGIQMVEDREAWSTGGG